MLSDADRDKVKSEFNADDAQVERDHAISHMLAAISEELSDDVQFFGGTALSRSYLRAGRLSEDIDLISIGDRTQVASRLTRILTQHLAREFGRPTFFPALTDVRGTSPVTMTLPSGPRVQIQLLPASHYPSWPFHPHQLQQRYADCGPAVLSIPTIDAFIAWKTTAFMDRRAPRDLWDLAALAALTGFTQRSADLFTRLGPLRSLPTSSTLPISPDETIWQRDLAHQTRLVITAEQARAKVVHAWANVVGGAS